MPRIERPRRFAWIAVAIALFASDANAVFIVNQPWLRPAAKGQSTEVYMNVTSTEGAAIVAVRSPVARSAVLLAAGNRDKPLERLHLPPGELVRLAPGGRRIALSEMRRAVNLGEVIELTLVLRLPGGERREIPVKVEARLHSPLDDERRAHSQPH